MPLPTVNGVTMTAQRKHVIAALYESGPVEPVEGQKRIPHDVQKRLLGVGTNALVHMAKDGIIERRTVGRSTKLIALRPEWEEFAATLPKSKKKTNRNREKKCQYCDEIITFGNMRRHVERNHPERVTWTPPARNGRRKNGHATRTPETLPVVSMPEIGATLTVWLVQQDSDGTMHVGLRNGTRSWLTQIEAAIV